MILYLDYQVRTYAQRSRLEKITTTQPGDEVCKKRTRRKIKRDHVQDTLGYSEKVERTDAKHTESRQPERQKDRGTPCAVEENERKRTVKAARAIWT